MLHKVKLTIALAAVAINAAQSKGVRTLEKQILLPQMTYCDGVSARHDKDRESSCDLQG
jgi:hypothetical protein